MDCDVARGVGRDRLPDSDSLFGSRPNCRLLSSVLAALLFAGLFAALSLAALDASAVDVSKVSPVTPGRGGSCPANYQLLKCRSVEECQKAIKSTQMVCVAAQSSSTGGRRRAASPTPPKNCPKPAPGSKVTPKC